MKALSQSSFIDGGVRVMIRPRQCTSTAGANKFHVAAIKPSHSSSLCDQSTLDQKQNKEGFMLSKMSTSVLRGGVGFSPSSALTPQVSLVARYFESTGAFLLGLICFVSLSAFLQHWWGNNNTTVSRLPLERHSNAALKHLVSVCRLQWGFGWLWMKVTFTQLTSSLQRCYTSFPFSAHIYCWPLGL